MFAIELARIPALSCVMEFVTSWTIINFKGSYQGIFKFLFRKIGPEAVLWQVQESIRFQREGRTSLDLVDRSSLEGSQNSLNLVGWPH